ncbi:avidin/streptavidin family protein [Legionella saoudiensis]|uniref:avidin/streptavidin family protein n=1 Tax=Legionella saoudiensis TaxID=1750561 RepID=UPI000730994B|nr:avidin/streptavidin family protein [Legionella saoudiensis]
MSFKTIFYTTIIASSLLSQTINAQENTTIFKNQRGSILELNILEDNKISGYFTTAVASKTCPQAIKQKRPITGYIVGNALTFSVVYPMCDSVLSVTGNLSKDKKAIDTLSILNKQADDITHEGPGARFIGHDLYEKTA